MSKKEAKPTRPERRGVTTIDPETGAVERSEPDVPVFVGLSHPEEIAPEEDVRPIAGRPPKVFDEEGRELDINGRRLDMPTEKA